jgi:hypothetical protein
LLNERIGRGWRDRVETVFDRAEHIYLRVLRVTILIIATLMIGYAAWLAISSAYKLSRSPDSVVEKVATVSAAEIADANVPEEQMALKEDAKPTASPEQRSFYAGFVNRYYNLFRTRFEPFRQPEDKILSRDEFDDNFVGSRARLDAIANGKLDFAKEKADLDSLLTVMGEAAAMPATQSRLQKYRSAKKVRVAKQVERSRTEYRRGWDNYSTDCAEWYYSPIGCPVQRAVQVPYTETVYEMQFPKGTQSHTQLFRAFQDRYFQLLNDRRATNAATADRERNEILTGQIEGGLSLWTALQIAGAFLVLMFFFLLIAIERHQRRMSDELESRLGSFGAVEAVE